MMTITDAAKEAFDRTGARPVWIAELHLGPFAYLTVLSFAAGGTDTVTLDVVHDGGTITRTYTEGTDFDAATSNAVTAADIAEAINADSNVNTRVGAFVVGSMVIVHGHPLRFQIPDSDTVERLRLSTSDAAAWKSMHAPVDRVYRFSSQDLDGYAVPEIRSVTTVQTSIDPVTRQATVGNVEIEFDDPNESSVIRGILARVLPRGRYVRLLVGTVDLDVDDFVPICGFFVEDVTPSQGLITIACAELTSVLQNKRFAGAAGVVGLTVGGVVLGSNASVTITIEDLNGDIVTQTYTEGTDFTGDATVQLGALRDAILADTTVNTLIGAVTNPGKNWLFIVPIPYGVPATAHATKITAVVTNDGGSAWLHLLPDAIVEYQHLTSAGFMNMHPLQVLRELYRTAGLETVWVDEDSFDRTNHPTWSHWGMSGHNGYKTEAEYIETSPDNRPDPDSDTGAFELQESICTLVQGGVWSDETGVVRFHRYDPEAAAVRHLTSDDYDSIEWLEQFSDLTNRVTIKGGAFSENETFGDRILYQLDDEFSQEMHSSRSDNNPAEVVFEDRYLGQFCEAEDTVTYLATNHLLVTGAWRAGIAGCRTIIGDDTDQDALDMVDPDTRDAWLLVIQPETGMEEIMRVVSAVPSTAVEIPLVAPSTTILHERDIMSGTPIASYVPGDGIVDVYDAWWIEVERAQLGTQAQSFGSGKVFVADLTIVKAIAEHRIRFSRGLPRGRFRTTARHIDLQLGDPFTHDARSYLDFLADGSTTDYVWEIVGKEIEFPLIYWTFALLKRSA